MSIFLDAEGTVAISTYLERDTGWGSPIIGDEVLRINRAATQAVRRELWLERPQLWEDAVATAKRGIVVVPASLDFPGLAVRNLELPHRVVPANLLEEEWIAGASLVIIGSPGFTTGTGGIEVLRDFVVQGGTLFTTGLAAITILDRMLPGKMTFGQEAPNSTRLRTRAHSDELAALGVDGDWDLPTGSRALTLENGGADLDPLITVTGPGARPSGHPIALRLALGGGHIVHLEPHVVDVELRPDADPTPAAMDPRWSELLADATPTPAGDLVAGLTSQSLNRAVQAVRFLTWVIATSGRARQQPAEGTPAA